MIFRMVLALWLLLGLPALAQDGGAILTVRGSGIVTVVPDIVTVRVGVDARAPSAAAALRLNSDSMGVVMALLKTRGVDKRDIQTREFSLNPLWKNRNTAYDKPLEIVGFTVSNVVQIKLRDIDLLGPLLDALTKSGANRIQSVQFGVATPKPFLDQARVLAVKEAIRKAKLYAAAAGRRLGEITTINEGGAAAPGPQLRALSAAVPIAEGELSLRADVTLRFRLR